MKKTFIAILFLIISDSVSSQVTMDTTSIGYNWYPEYVTFLPKEKVDSAFIYANTELVPVIFKVNKYELVPNEQLQDISSLINRITNDYRVKLAYLWIGGSASPEGPIVWNKQLGDYRSKALASFLLNNTNLPKEKMKVDNLWEDWYSVSRKLEISDFKNKDEVLYIINTEPDWQKRKNKIQAIDNNQTWHRLVNQIFPPFRNARMVIVCNAEQIRQFNDKIIPWEYMASVPSTTFPKPQPLYKPDEYRFIALKTNALYLAGLVANLGIEVELWRKWSLDIPVWYSPYNIKKNRHIRVLATQPEVRFWTKKAGQGNFIGLHSHVIGYNVAINDNGRYQDPDRAAWGFGLSYGYSFNLGKAKRWAIELNLGAGFINYEFDEYKNWKDGPLFRSGSGYYWGITRAGVSVAYKWYVKRKR